MSECKDLKERMGQLEELYKWVTTVTVAEDLDGKLGMQLIYLFGTIIKGDDSVVELYHGEELHQLLRGLGKFKGGMSFGPAHWVWDYITFAKKS